MKKAFYYTPAYRKKQSQLSKKAWQKGKFDFLRKRVDKICVRKKCNKKFFTTPSDPKKYCSARCSAIVANTGRVLSNKTKNKIRRALSGRTYPSRKKPPSYSVCKRCHNQFRIKYWRPKDSPQKYCSVACAMKDIGSRPTSPKASKGKGGIREDINPDIYFYSTWEANYARIMDYLKIQWVHQPKRFQLKTQKYTLDFYLPQKKKYVEIKNFLSEYSAKRDREFRELYPQLELELILKENYLKLKEEFSRKIKNWEY